jgi:type I restriction enzyme S subunit
MMVAMTNNSQFSTINSQLKQGWEIKKLGEVCEINPKKSETNNLPINHLVSFLPMKDLGIAQSQIKPKSIKQLSEVKGSYTYFKDNDILLAKVTPCFENGKLGIAKNLKNAIGFGSSEYIVFRPINNVLSDYIFYILYSTNFRKKGKKLMLGAVGLKRLSKNYVENFPIPLPPLPEQQRIVAILDKAFTTIATAKENAQQNLLNAKELFESYLQGVFENKGVDWEEKTLEEMFKIGSSKRIMKKDWTVDGVPFYGGKEIVKLAKFGAVVSNAYISEEKYDDYASKYDMPQHGDILITARGTIGVGYIVKKGDKFYYKDGNIISMRAKITSNPTFILYAFKSNVIIDQLKKLTGATVSHLPIEKAKELVLMIPNFSAQNNFVEKIQAMEAETKKLETIYQQKINDLEELKKSVLNKAFKGEL